MRVLCLLLASAGCGGAEPAAETPVPADGAAIADGSVAAESPAPTSAPSAPAADTPLGVPPVSLADPATIPRTVRGLENGAYATEIDLEDARDGSRFRLSDRVGPTASRPVEAVVVSFSASWCGPCMASLPQLASLVQEHEGKLLVVIASIDESDSGFHREVEAVRRAGLDAPVVRAPEALQAAWLGDTRNIPHLFIINAVGEVLVQDRGYGENVAGVLPRQIGFARSTPDYVER